MNTGDNTILSLQAGRSLVSSYQDAQEGKRLGSGVAYLADKSVYDAKCPSDDKATDLDVMERAWANVSANAIRRAVQVYEAALKRGAQKDVAMEQCSQERFVAAKVHTMGYIFRQFTDALKKMEGEEPAESNVVQTLRTICHLYGAFQCVGILACGVSFPS